MGEQPFVIDLWYQISPFLDLAIALLLYRKRQRLFALGFLVFAVNGLIWRFLVAETFTPGLIWREVTPWLGMAGGLLTLLGAIQLKADSVTSGGAMLMAIINRFYSTDDLISRVADVRTANEDLENLKTEWHLALESLLRRDPERTALVSSNKYGRTLLLERYCPMGTFSSFSCGQLRSVEIAFSGPGDSAPWMTVTIRCSVDQVPVGSATLRNDRALACRDNPGRLREFQRIIQFLETGKFREPFTEQLERFAEAFLVLLLLPVNIIVLGVGILAAVFRSVFSRGRIRTRFVATQRPSLLPLEQAGAPVGYWYVLLENQADKQKELLDAVLAGFEERGQFGAKIYKQDVVQWGGYSLKETRQQTVVEFRRCKAYISVYAYGKDLYVRWDSHLNSSTWSLKKFSYYSGIGYQFTRSRLSWAQPLFTEVPSIYEFAPSVSATTDYDWADLDALEGLAHEVTTREVKRLKERYDIEKEIDYEMKKGTWSSAERQDEARSKEPRQAGPQAWGARFARKK